MLVVALEGLQSLAWMEASYQWFPIAVEVCDLNTESSSSIASAFCKECIPLQPPRCHPEKLKPPCQVDVSTRENAAIQYPGVNCVAQGIAGSPPRSLALDKAQQTLQVLLREEDHPTVREGGNKRRSQSLVGSDSYKYSLGPPVQLGCEWDGAY